MDDSVVKCGACGSAIEENRARRRARFCSDRCRNRFQSLEYRARNPVSPISKGTRGAISELAVCLDLMQRGAEVFRAVSPSSSCDLAVLFREKLVRVEVRTGTRQPNGRLFYPKSSKDDGRQDLWAVVDKVSGEIEYDPPFETMASLSGLARAR